MEITADMNLPEKDISYKETIENFEKAFRKNGFKIEVVSWLNPIDSIWSVHVRDSECHNLYTNGKGISMEGALSSAYGEFFERLSTGYFFADYCFAGIDDEFPKWKFFPDEKWFEVEGDASIPEGVLNKKLINYYNYLEQLDANHLMDSNTVGTKGSICTLPFTSLNDNKVINFPVNILDNLYVSNGMAAGNSLNEARVQALSEIIERYVKNRIIAEKITLPDIPAAVLSKYKNIQYGKKILESAGFSILFKDASLEGKYPVVNITLIDRKNSGVYAAFGAHPRFHVALERTLTELLQGRDLDSLDIFPSPVFDEALVADPGNLEEHFIDSSGLLHWKYFLSSSDFSYKGWSFEGGRNEELAYLENIIKSEGYEIYMAQYNWMGVDVCRLIIPGMSEIYPVHELVYNNKNRYRSVRDILLNIENAESDECEVLYEELCDSGYSGDHKVGELIGIPGESSISVSELLLFLSLGIGRFDDALIWCENAIEVCKLNHQDSTLYRCLNFLIESETDGILSKKDINYISKLFYSESVVVTCHNLMSSRVISLSMISEKMDSLKNGDEFRHISEAFSKCRKIMHNSYSIVDIQGEK
ncbi:MAG: YcaO-like family protein [Deltaproteobacteria bacterium]|nr:YcaO-like family protein [Deltaproteobacteria bacterium]